MPWIYFGRIRERKEFFFNAGEYRRFVTARKTRITVTPGEQGIAREQQAMTVKGNMAARMGRNVQDPEGQVEFR